MLGLKPLAVTLLASAHTRLALLANELQTEKQQAMTMLWLGLALAFCLSLGLVLAVFLAVVVWWAQRTVVLGLFATLFLLLAAYFHATFRRLTQSFDPVFAASLAELQEDVRLLKAASHVSATR